MITILHGDHIVDSRDRRATFIKKAQDAQAEVLILEGKGATKEMLVQSLESRSLFHQEKLVVIDNLISSLRKGKTRDDIIAYLYEGKFDADVVLWEGKGVGRSIIKLKKAAHVQTTEFKTPVVIFSLLDSLAPHNARESLGILSRALKYSVPEIIFSMMVRQFRLLVGIASNAEITEVKRMAPWQGKKLSRQAAQFSGSELKRLYRELMIIDYQVKTGRSPYDLTRRIEQFIITL